MSSSHQGFHAEHFVEGEGEGGNVGCGEHFRCGCEITLMFIFTLYTIYNYFCEDKVLFFLGGGGESHGSTFLTDRLTNLKARYRSDNASDMQNLHKSENEINQFALYIYYLISGQCAENKIIADSHAILDSLNVTGSGKRYTIAHIFKIELLAPRGRVSSQL